VLTGDERGRHHRAPVDLVRHRGHLVVLPTRSPREDAHA
jgi:hypothetical protein